MPFPVRSSETCGFWQSYRRTAGVVKYKVAMATKVTQGDKTIACDAYAITFGCSWNNTQIKYT